MYDFKLYKGTFLQMCRTVFSYSTNPCKISDYISGRIWLWGCLCHMLWMKDYSHF